MASSQRGDRRPRGKRLPLAPSPAARAMGGESAHPCFGRKPVGGATGAHFYIPSENPDSDNCQILHGAATWCLLLPRTVKSSVGMLYGLFRIDFYALSYAWVFDVVVWPGGVNLSDSQRCQTLYIAALWCRLNPRAPTSTVRPRHGHFFARQFLRPLIRGQRPGYTGI